MLAKLCPKCHSADVRRSRRRTLVDHLAIFVMRRPYRCRNCRHRFFEFVFAQRVSEYEVHGPEAVGRYNAKDGPEPEPAAEPETAPVGKAH